MSTPVMMTLNSQIRKPILSFFIVVIKPNRASSDDLSLNSFGRSLHALQTLSHWASSLLLPKGQFG